MRLVWKDEDGDDITMDDDPTFDAWRAMHKPRCNIVIETKPMAQAAPDVYEHAACMFGCHHEIT